jgi:thioredoxin reductase (NADPH)
MSSSPSAASADSPTAKGPVVIHGREDCRLSFALRDFLKRSAVEFAWRELRDDAQARQLPGVAHLRDPRLPVVELPAGPRLYAPSLRELADRLGFLARPRRTHYDLSIYGAGPAGLSAAVYAAAEGLKVVLIERAAVGGQSSSSSLIENYLGFPDGISGAELAERARRQALKFGCEILQLREGVNARFAADGIHVDLADGSRLSARTNLCATGVDYRRLGLPDEERFLGAGLYYGAGHSEAARLAGETVMVVGGANSAGQAAMHFSQHARKVVMLVRAADLTDSMSAYLSARILANPVIELRFHTAISALAGDNALRGVTLRHTHTGAEEIHDAAHVFVCIGGHPHTEWARDTPIRRDPLGYLLTGSDLYVDGHPPADWPLARAPYFLETSVLGCFAAGDVRHGSTKRYATAVGEGAMTVTFVHAFLEQNPAAS